MIFRHKLTKFYIFWQFIMKIQNIEISKLIPYELNNKIHDETQIQRIANSIKEFWFTQPIVIDKTNIVVIWHWRLEAAKRLWLKEVPCIIKDDLSDIQIKKLRFWDNKLNESEWNIENLKLDLMDLDDMNLWDLEFSVEEIIWKSDSPVHEKWWFENKEYWVNDLWTFEHKCPKCWFEFNSSDE